MSVIKNKVCFALLGLVIGCATISQPHYTAHPLSQQTPVRIVPVAIDIQFSPTQQQELKSAIKEWNYALNGQIRLDIYTDRFDMEEKTISYIYNAKGVMLLSVSHLGNVMLHLDTNNIAITSHIGTGHEIYFIKEKMENHSVRKVALHEIGHFLGAYHHQSGLMQLEYNEEAYSCIDYETLLQVVSYNESAREEPLYLNINQMNWCQR